MKVINKLLRLVVVACFVATVIVVLSGCKSKNTEDVEAKLRTIELKENKIDYEAVLNEYEESSFEEEGPVFKFEGKKRISLDAFSSIENLSEKEINEMESTYVSYKYSYNIETRVITLSAIMENELGVIEIEEVTGISFINEKEELDAVMDFEGEKILLSEMINAGMIENYGWFSRLVKSVVKVAVVTAAAVVATAAIVGTAGVGGIAVMTVVGVGSFAASTSQTVKANTNYNANKNKSLHDDVEAKGYITNQDFYEDWHFGFTTLDEVGCEVISIYNAMVSLGRRKHLADIIYDVEMLNIDYDIGFGYLGSNPNQIYRYLAKHSVRYVKYNFIEKLEKMANSFENCKIIFSSENNESVMGVHSIHTFFIEKQGNTYTSYNGYSNHEEYQRIKIRHLGNLSGFVEYKFKCGYILY